MRLWAIRAGIIIAVILAIVMGIGLAQRDPNPDPPAAADAPVEI
jgi:hypothetical protein